MNKKYKEKYYIKNPETQCWDWIGCRIHSGYGYLRPNRKKTLAHRYFFELYYGPFDKTLNVLHRCDNPSCVNPEHLWLGTHSDNMQDKYKKERHNQKGIHNGNYRPGKYVKT